MEQSAFAEGAEVVRVVAGGWQFQKQAVKGQHRFPFATWWESIVTHPDMQRASDMPERGHDKQKKNQITSDALRSYQNRMPSDVAATHQGLESHSRVFLS